MGLKRVSWVRRYQGQCRALRPLGHQGCRLRNHKKDQPLCSGYMGFPKGVIVAARNEPKSGVLPIVYLHAGLEIGSAIPYAIHRESDEDSHALGSQRSLCHLAW